MPPLEVNGGGAIVIDFSSLGLGAAAEPTSITAISKALGVIQPAGVQSAHVGSRGV